MFSFLLKDMNLLGAAGLALAILLAIALIMYRRQVGDLLDRVFARPDPEGPPVSQQKEVAQSVGITPNIAPESKHSTTLANRILEDITSAPVPVEEKLRLLSLLAANFVLQAEFQARYRVIYRSQIEALSGLRQRGPHSLEQYYKAFLGRVEERKPEVEANNIDTSFEAWVSFLTGVNYPYIEIESGIARITERGDAFMEFVGRSGGVNHNL